METTKPAKPSGMERLLAMNGKKLYDFLEEQIKLAKIDRTQATKLSKAWVEHQGLLSIAGFGWLNPQEIDEIGLVKVGNEWCVEGESILCHEKGNDGKERHIWRTSVPQAQAYFDKKYAARRNNQTFDDLDEITSVAEDIDW